MQPSPEAPVGLLRRRTRFVAVGGVMLTGIAIALVVLLGSGPPSHGASTNGVPPGETTAAVTRRTLSETSTVDGTLGYAEARELYDRLAGTFTWLPAAGALIARGGTLFKVNDLPVVLMYGSVPAYRTLKEGVSEGPDVAELNRNLIALGYDPYRAIADDGAFGAATAAAVRRWQMAEGLEETGEVELGRVIFAPGARRVTTVHEALGQDPPGSSDEPAGSSRPAGGAKAPSADEGQAAREHPPAEATLAKEALAREHPPAEATPAKEAPAKEHPPAEATPAKEAPAKEAPAKAAPAEEGKAKGAPAKKPAKKAPAKEPPAKEAPAASKPSGKEASTGKGSPSVEEPAGEGSEEPSAGAGTLVLSTTSTRQVVQVKLKPEQQQLAHLGESAPILLPGGETVGGRIVEVGSVASESGKEAEKAPGGGNDEGNGEQATVQVTLALDHHVAHLDQAPVSVELVKGVRHDVLAVPATALTATAGGGYAVQALEGTRRVDIPVTTGMFAQGYVQVEGTGLRAGLTVLESE